jgi:hypothetical protein
MSERAMIMAHTRRLAFIEHPPQAGNVRRSISPSFRVGVAGEIDTRGPDRGPSKFDGFLWRAKKRGIKA